MQFREETCFERESGVEATIRESLLVTLSSTFVVLRSSLVDVLCSTSRFCQLFVTPKLGAADVPNTYFSVET